MSALSKCTSDLQACQSTVQNLQAQLATDSATIVALQDQLATLNADLATLEAQIVATEQTLANTQSALAQCQTDLYNCQNPVVPTVDLSAVVTLNGVDYAFTQNGATDLGDYVAPTAGFTQKCFRAVNSSLPLMTVFFRPDSVGGRNEVVFEYGHCFNGTPVDLGPYTVVIKKGADVIAAVSVPKHYYFSRWRWQSSPRPIVNSVSALIANGCLPNYATLSGRNEAGIATVSPYSIMGSSSLSKDFGATGERPEIGPLTSSAGEYVCTQSANSRDQMMAWAEAAGTLPVHRRDENTGKAISFVDYPGANWFWSNLGYTPWIPGSSTTGFSISDASHYPSLCYLPFLLTEDPYFLEEIQFQTTYQLGNCNPGSSTGDPTYTRGGSRCIIRRDQGRTYAWGLRDLAHAAKATPASVPSWLLPKSYFETILSTNQTYFTTVIAAVTGRLSVIHGGPGEHASALPYQISLWQEDFMAFVMKWLVRMGYTNWDGNAIWKVYSARSRSNGTSGWPKEHPTAYWTDTKTLAGVEITSWADLWANELAAYPTEAIVSPGTLNTYSDYTYVRYLRAVLAAFNAPEFTWLDQQLITKGVKIPFKWSVVP